MSYPLTPIPPEPLTEEELAQRSSRRRQLWAYRFTSLPPLGESKPEGTIMPHWLDTFHERMDQVIADVTGETRKVLEAEVAALKANHVDVIARGTQLVTLIESAVSAVQQPAGTSFTVMRLMNDFVAYLEETLTKKPVPAPEPAPAAEPAAEEPAAPAEEPAPEVPAEEPAPAEGEQPAAE